jgi:glycosyltransferase involved in cell wall biosynthesis
MGMGGADRQILELSSGLLAKGYEVLIVSLTDTGFMGAEAGRRKTKVLTLGLPRKKISLTAPFRLYQTIREFKPEILVTFMFHANVLGRIVGRIASVPVVIASIRNEYFGGRWRELAEKYTEPLSTITTTNSQLAAKSLVSRGIIPNARLKVIPNGIDVSKYNAAETIRDTMRKSLDLSDHHFLWLAVGRLHVQKDYPTLLHALTLLKDFPFRLCIAGQYLTLGNELRELANELGVGDRVVFLGAREDVPALLSAADAFVFSSAWEGLPNAVMEAMASGLPVVATDVGGVSEMVQSNISGIIVDPADSEGMAHAMIEVMTFSREQRVAMGMAGRRKIIAEFSLSSVIEQWDCLFKISSTH